MIPISVGVSGSLSAEQSPNQSVYKAGVPMSSVYRERKSNDNLINSVWESPTNGPVVHESVEIVQDEEIGSNTEDVFSDWLQSYPESGSEDAAADSASFFGSGLASLSLGCDDCDVIPQRPRGPMVPIAIGCRDSSDILSLHQSSNGVIVPTSHCRLFPPPPPVTPNILVHEVVPSISYSRKSPSAALVPSQPADSLSSPATQPVHEVEPDGAITIPTPESLARVFDVRDSEVTDVAEVFAGGVGEHALSAWPSSYFEFDTEENSKESYSAVHSDPVHTRLDSDDGCEVLAARASSRVRKAVDSVREEPN